jgi:hypothetical protein
MQMLIFLLRLCFFVLCSPRHSSHPVPLHGRRLFWPGRSKQVIYDGWCLSAGIDSIFICSRWKGGVCPLAIRDFELTPNARVGTEEARFFGFLLLFFLLI